MPDIMIILPRIGILELGSGISFTRHLVVILSRLGIVDFGKDISSIPDILATSSSLGLTKVSDVYFSCTLHLAYVDLFTTRLSDSALFD
jgi:hypothetical protein